MAEARRKDQWDHTAALLALLAEINRNRDERRDPFTPAEFHPFHKDEPREKPERIDSKTSWAILKQGFTTGTGVAVALKP